jgi:hypothetical protein
MTRQIQMQQVNDDRYESPTGHVMAREYGETPNGNNFGGRWVLRENGLLIDFDQYSNDLAERYSLNLGR